MAGSKRKNQRKKAPKPKPMPMRTPQAVVADFVLEELLKEEKARGDEKPSNRKEAAARRAARQKELKRRQKIAEFGYTLFEAASMRDLTLENLASIIHVNPEVLNDCHVGRAMLSDEVIARIQEVLAVKFRTLRFVRVRKGTLTCTCNRRARASASAAGAAGPSRAAQE